MRRRWRDRLRLPLIVLAVLNAGVYFAYTLPQSVRQQSAAARVKILREEVERDRRVTAALRHRSDAMRSNQADVGRFYARLGPKETLSRVRAEITDLARELGLKVGNFSYDPEQVKGGEGVSQLQVRMPVSGTYHELASFLDRLERSSYFVTVDQIQLRKQAASGEADLDLTLSAFYRTPAGMPGAAGEGQ